MVIVCVQVEQDQDGPGDLTSSDLPLEVIIVDYRWTSESQGKTSPLPGWEPSVSKVGATGSVTTVFPLFANISLQLSGPAGSTDGIPAAGHHLHRQHLLAVASFPNRFRAHGRVTVLMGVPVVRGQLQSLGEVLAAGLHDVHGGEGVTARRHRYQNPVNNRIIERFQFTQTMENKG